MPRHIHAHWVTHWDSCHAGCNARDQWERFYGQPREVGPCTSITRTGTDTRVDMYVDMYTSCDRTRLVQVYPVVVGTNIQQNQKGAMAYNVYRYIYACATNAHPYKRRR